MSLHDSLASDESPVNDLGAAVGAAHQPAGDLVADLSIVILGGLGSAAGIALGLSARRLIAEPGERGHGLAIAGIIVGIITLLAAIGYWIIIARYVGGHGGAGHGGGGGGC